MSSQPSEQSQAFESAAEQALFEELFDDHVAHEEDELLSTDLVAGSHLEDAYLSALHKRHPTAKRRAVSSQRHARSPHSAQLVSPQVLDALLDCAPASLRHTDKERLKRVVLASNHNHRHHSTEREEHADTTHKPERTLDRQIRAAFATHRALSAAAAERARWQFDLLTEARHATSAAVMAGISQCYSRLVGCDGLAAVPRAAAACPIQDIPVQSVAVTAECGSSPTTQASPVSLAPRMRRHKGNACGQHKAFAHRGRIVAAM
jgi:hypothetical protein